MFSKSWPRGAPKKTKSFCNPHGLEDRLAYRRTRSGDSDTLLSGHDPLRRIQWLRAMPPTPDSGILDLNSNGLIQESLNASMCRLVRCLVGIQDNIKIELVKDSKKSEYVDLWVKFV